MTGTAPLRGRHRESAELETLIERARAGRSGALVVSGEAGVGKTALLEQAAAAARHVRVERMVASESEMELAYAGLHQLCGHMMGSVEHLPVPQREAVEAALGLREGSAPSPFLVGLAVLGLLTEAADEGALLCIVDDAQWLDDASARAVAFAARRLDAEGIAITLVMRTVDEVFAGLPRLVVEGLGHEDARELLRHATPGGLDERIRDQVIAEARGNPLALRELPRALSPAEIAGGFALTGSMPLESRIEQSLVAQLEPLPASARLLLLLAAADPTGDPGLLWRASEVLGLGPADFDAAAHVDALVVGTRVGFRHPLVRSAVYRAASPDDRRRVHAALADVTSAERDPDRRAWHRASATLRPDEEVAADLERSALRARTRGGAAAAAAFLERATELTPAPFRRGERLIAAAEAKHDAGAPAIALRLLEAADALPLTALQQALVARLRARAGYALRRDRGGAQRLLEAAQGLEGLDPVLARDTYIEALAAAMYGGRLGDAEQAAAVAHAILEATPPAEETDRARDLILRGQALLAARGQEAAIATLRRAQRAFLEEVPDALELHWMWYASRAAQDLWDPRMLRALAGRQLELARAEGVVTVLPIALSLLMLAQTVDGDLDAAEASCDEIDAIKEVTGNPLPQYGRLFLAAYRGQEAETKRWAERIRADGHARGEGYALSAANFSEAILYNGLGRFAESVASGRRELPYTHELNHAMRTLLELVEAAAHTGERALAEQAYGQLASVTRPVGTSWAIAVMAMSEAQLRAGDEAEGLFLDAIKRFEHERIPVMVGRSRLLYGEQLRREGRDAGRRRGRAAAGRVRGADPLRPERLRRPRRAGAGRDRGGAAGPGADAGDAPHRPGAQRRPPGPRGADEPGHRRPALHQRPHRRIPPAQGLHEARHQGPHRPEDRARRTRPVTAHLRCIGHARGEDRHSGGGPVTGSLQGRQRESAELGALVDRARAGRSGALVVSGEAGVGKTALLEQAAAAARHVRVEHIGASESEMELAYSGLHQLCGPMMGSIEHLPVPQREAIEAALGLREGSAPSPFLVGLALLGLLTEAADEGALLCIVDDAQWLDDASARAVAFAARRLDAEGVAVVLAMRTVGEAFAGLPHLVVEGLDYEDARELLRLATPGGLDERIRDQVIAEARGNPLALRELPRALSPAEIAGGFALTGSMPLESRIEQSLVAQLEPLPASARLLLLLAAADPTGDPGLLWRASEVLGLGTADFDAAEDAGALVVGTRVGFRHPLVRSAVYRVASPADRRRVHAALADVTDAEHDPCRRAWHRASATLQPAEEVAADLERSAVRARTRGGAAAAGAFLERAAELTPSPFHRGQRLIAAAEAKHEAGAPAAALHLLEAAGALPLSALQEALVARLRARAGYALRRDRAGAQSLLAAAQGLEGLAPALARDTYIDALAAATYGGRLGDAEQAAAVAHAILEATPAAAETDRARDLILRGQALLATEGQEAAIATLRRAQRAFLEEAPDSLELHWVWFASRAAQDLWDPVGLRTLADRQVELARAEGVVTVLPIALSLLTLAQMTAGELDAAEASCDEIDAIKEVTGNPLPPYGRLLLAAYRGQAGEAELLAERIRNDGHARGEGHALSAANFSEAVLYNGLGRFADAVAAGRRELPYTHELNLAMRTLLEVVEAAAHTGDRALAEQAYGQLAAVTRPVGTNYALAVVAMAEAQVRGGDEAECLYRDAIKRFGQERMPVWLGRCRLVYGEELNRRHRSEDAREQLRAAYGILSGLGLNGFADRAARELGAIGEAPRVRAQAPEAHLTDQELNVARLAREGLTNRDIGARLFISARTAEYHLRKVFMKLGIKGRTDLKTALDASAWRPASASRGT